jgi:subtilisin family serine protease
MKTRKFVFFLATAFSLLLSQTASAQYNSKVYVDGELLVKFKDGTISGRAITANRQIGARVVEEFSDLGWQRVRLPFGMSVETAVARYANQDGVEYAQPNYYYRLQITPNDPQFPAPGMYGLLKINAPSAWDLTTGSSNTVVAVIDTGIRYTHEDLAANMWTNPGETAGNGVDDDGNGFVDDVHGYDFFYNDGDPLDDATGFGGHGTHVAGTIGAVGNNSIGVTGINWNVRLMAIKIYSPAGTDSTSAMLVNAYNYVRLMKTRGVNIRVTNNSYGGCNEACGYDQATKDALDALGEAGILNVFAAGNNGRDIEINPFYPASYNSPSILAVANSTSDDSPAGSSNYGAVSVDVAAPGTGILSAYRDNNGYATLSGTSMASPHGAGAAALLASYNPNLSAASLKATLMNTVDALPAWNGVVKTGGRLNVDRALRNQTICNFSLSQTTLHVPTPLGGAFSVNVAAPANCDYSVKSNVSWITVNSGSVGSGNGTIAFTVAGLNNGIWREGAINIAGLTLTVTQSPESPLQTFPYLDFDGDRRTDYAAIQNSGGGGGGMIWHNLRSRDGYAVANFGLFADDIPIPADYDGDGKTDIAVWRNTNGTFYVLQSQNNAFQAIQFGAAGDNPNVSQDFDGDFKADFAVTRRENGKLVWYILGSATGFRGVQFGNESDLPLRGDFDGDRKADLAVYRPATDSPANTFFVLRSSDGGLQAANFGISTTDKIVPGDYDGDGRTDFAVWRPNQNPDESGVFYVQRSRDGFSAFGWGNAAMKIPANSILGQ